MRPSPEVFPCGCEFSDGAYFYCAEHRARLKPLGDRLLLRTVAAPERVGQLWIPPAAQQDYTLCQAEIIARGDGVKDWRLQPGAHLVVKRFGKTPVNDDGHEFVVWEKDVLAIVDLTKVSEAENDLA